MLIRKGSCCLPGARKRKGVALLEFALVVPLLLLLVFGILEFGVYAKNSLAVANATREGARAAALGRSTTDIEARIMNSLTNQGGVSAPIQIEMKRDDANDANGYSYDIALGGATCSGTSCKNDAPMGSMIRIRVIARNQSITGLLGFMSRPLQNETIMRREG